MHMQIGGVSRKKMIHYPKQLDLVKKVQFHFCAVYLINGISNKIIRHEYDKNQILPNNVAHHSRKPKGKNVHLNIFILMI